MPAVAVLWRRMASRRAASDEAGAGHRPLAKELHAAAVATEDETETHASEHVGDPGTALRAGRCLLQIRTDHRFDVEMNRLVFASHQVPPRLSWALFPPPPVEHSRNILS